MSYRGMGGNGGRSQYHQCIVWYLSAGKSPLRPFVKSVFWLDDGWQTHFEPISVESIYGGHTVWLNEQINGRRAA